jgi:hypothetical protein
MKAVWIGVIGYAGKFRATAVFLTVLSMGFAGASNAASLMIKPGMWETTMTTTSAMTGTTTRSISECRVEEEFDPTAMLEDAKGCELVDNQLSGNTLTYTMNCDVDGGQGIMRGMYEINGDEGHGRMDMEFSFGGQSMVIENSFTARRLGDC